MTSRATARTRSRSESPKPRAALSSRSRSRSRTKASATASDIASRRAARAAFFEEQKQGRKIKKKPAPKKRKKAEPKPIVRFNKRFGCYVLRYRNQQGPGIQMAGAHRLLDEWHGPLDFNTGTSRSGKVRAKDGRRVDANLQKWAKSKTKSLPANSHRLSYKVVAFLTANGLRPVDAQKMVYCERSRAATQIDLLLRDEKTNALIATEVKCTSADAFNAAATFVHRSTGVRIVKTLSSPLHDIPYSPQHRSELQIMLGACLYERRFGKPVDAGLVVVANEHGVSGHYVYMHRKDRNSWHNDAYNDIKSLLDLRARRFLMTASERRRAPGRPVPRNVSNVRFLVPVTSNAGRKGPAVPRINLVSG